MARTFPPIHHCPESVRGQTIRAFCHHCLTRAHGGNDHGYVTYAEQPFLRGVRGTRTCAGSDKTICFRTSNVWSPYLYTIRFATAFTLHPPLGRMTGALHVFFAINLDSRSLSVLVLGLSFSCLIVWCFGLVRFVTVALYPCYLLLPPHCTSYCRGYFCPSQNYVCWDNVLYMARPKQVYP
jgi:hypothetical protein